MSENNNISSLQDKQYVTTEEGIQLALSPAEYEEMKKLQKYILEIMIVVDEFCRNNNITYYLGEGSLLGAVRHKGFVPWDDDADIVMPREDYERFLKLAADGLKDGYQLDCVDTNPKHWSIISTVQITRQTEFEKTMYNGAALYCGPCIDIFPLDYAPNADAFNLKIRSKCIRILRRALWIKSGVHTKSKYNTLKKKLFYYYPCKFICSVYSIQSLHKKLSRLMLKTNDSNNKYLVNFASLYTVNKETFDKNLFGKPVEIEFEGHKFYAPSQSEQILKIIYNDYTAMPPVEKRKSKHHFNNFVE